MPIGLTDILAALGSFPIMEDTSLLGGLRAVGDASERDAIDDTNRKAGMFVWVEANSTLYRLGPGLTNADWIEYGNGTGDVQIDAEVSTLNTTPTSIHSYVDPALANRGTICYDLLVTAIGPLGNRHASFKIVATFERSGSSITEKDVTFIGYTNPQGWDVVFNISGTTINTQVVGETNGAGGVKWRAVGYITRVDEAFA
jgi:hypothetical protein